MDQNQDDADLDREPGALETDAVAVRVLCPEDLDAMVRMDRLIIGRARREYLSRKLETALKESMPVVSLAAEVDRTFAGFLMGTLYYGEFGVPEPVAILDTLAVDPEMQRRKVASALLRQFLANLSGLRIERVETQVGWTQVDLIGFFARAGFVPAPRLCLELRVDATRR